jgi:hypothetical protein
MKGDEMGKACSTHGSEKRNAREIFVGKHKRERKLRRIILDCITMSFSRRPGDFLISSMRYLVVVHRVGHDHFLRLS